MDLNETQNCSLEKKSLGGKKAKQQQRLTVISNEVVKCKIKGNKLVIHMVDSLSVLSRVMDFQSAMETFAEAWVAANVTQVNITNQSSFRVLKQIVTKKESFSWKMHNSNWTIPKDMKQKRT